MFLTQFVHVARELYGVPLVDRAPEGAGHEGGDGVHHTLVLAQVVAVGVVRGVVGV